MKKKMLFIHSAGVQTSGQGSDYLLAYLQKNLLQKNLGSDYELLHPLMPDAEQPHYVAWKNEIARIFSTLKDDEIILIGHSLGGSVLLKYLAEEQPALHIRDVFLVAVPYWGAPTWELDEFLLPDNCAQQLPAAMRLHFYQSENDDVVSITHLSLYARAFPRAKICAVTGRGHQYKTGLPELVRDVEAIEE